MASAIYYEANLEPIEGKRAVYDVIMNRAEESGKSVCKVVLEPYQFSWVRHKPIKKYDKQMQKMLINVKNEGRILESENYFFRKNLHPRWARKMKCRNIYNHRFCEGEYE